MPNEPINRRGEKWVRGVGLVRALNQKLDEVDRRVVQIVRNVPAHRWKRSVVGAGSKSSCSINGLFAIFAPTVSYYFFLSLGRFATRSDLCPGFALNHPPSAANAARGTWVDCRALWAYGAGMRRRSSLPPSPDIHMPYL